MRLHLIVYGKEATAKHANAAQIKLRAGPDEMAIPKGVPVGIYDHVGHLDLIS